MDADFNFYFLEMNTRLQVEHPVTEMITGLDLVREQIRVARGEKLGYSQADLKIQGHSVEARVYAENPFENFNPDIGKLHVYNRPHGPGVRVDDGYEQGMDIPIFYDPMISKLITYGATREIAIQRMLRACNDYEIVGVQTTLPFIEFVMKHNAFKSGEFDTNFVKQYFTPEQLQSNDEELMEIAVLASAHFLKNEGVKNTENEQNTIKTSLWKINRS